MNPWGNPALAGYSCEDIPSRTTRSRLLVRKEEIRPHVWPEIPKDLSVWIRPVCQTLSKALDISSPTARVASPAPGKSPTNSIRYQKICSWSRTPKTILEIKKMATFLKVINSSIIYKFFKDFTNHGKKTNRAVVFSSRPFPNILKYRDQ